MQLDRYRGPPRQDGRRRNGPPARRPASARARVLTLGIAQKRRSSSRCRSKPAARWASTSAVIARRPRSSTWPVIQPAWSEAKNSTAWTMSSAVPSRRSAMLWISRAWPSCAHRLPLPLGRGVGADEARRDAVDGDPEGPELVGQLAGQADLAGLGAGIGLDAGEADAQPGARGDVDDPAVALRASSPARPPACTKKAPARLASKIACQSSGVISSSGRPDLPLARRPRC